MQTIHLIVYSENGEIKAVEGTPTEQEKLDHAAKQLMMRYSGVELILWIAGNVREETAFAAIPLLLQQTHNAVAQANSIAH